MMVRGRLSTKLRIVDELASGRLVMAPIAALAIQARSYW
jgi:hypothetical protein